MKIHFYKSQLTVVTQNCAKLLLVFNNHKLSFLIKRAFGFSVCWILCPRFSFFFFSAFTRLRRTDFTVQRQFLLFIHCFVTVHHCISTVHILKNIKNESHDTIYTFKNYFITVFSVFSFQFSISTTINSIQTDPKSVLTLSRNGS